MQSICQNNVQVSKLLLMSFTSVYICKQISISATIISELLPTHALILQPGMFTNLLKLKWSFQICLKTLLRALLLLK